MDALAEFARSKTQSIDAMAADTHMRELSRAWFIAASRHRYSYNFEWFGVPIIQFPPDLVALQEVVWSSRPDCIIETGVAHGGSLLFYASLLKAMDVDGVVIGVDIDIRAHNRERLDSHPLRARIDLVQGSSTAAETVDAVRTLVGAAQNPLVILDSNHTYEHVAREMELYAPFVRKGGYLVVLDTVVDDMPASFSADRPWGPGHGPKRAVTEFLERTSRFQVDQSYNDKLLITVAPDGFLQCTADS
jgi:cephalosporin hydroxylase